MQISVFGLLLPLALARYMITASWLTSDSCSDIPPDSIFGWMLERENTTSKPRNYAWPVGYIRQASFNAYSNRCWSTLKVALSKECCVASLNITRSRGYKAYTTILAEPTNPLLAAPKSAMQTTYCHLRAKSYNPSSGFGFDHAFYQANGLCIPEHQVQCHSNGTLARFPLDGCSGAPTLISLREISASFTLPVLGDVEGSLVTVTEAQSEFSWTILDRVSEYSIRFQHASDYAFVALFILSLSLVLYSLYVHSLRAIKTRKLPTLFGVCVQILWLIYVILRFYTQFGNFTYAIDGSIYFFLLVASLGSTMLSLSFLLSVLPRYNRFYWVFMTMLVVVHFGLTFSQYTRFRLISIPIFTATNVQIFIVTLQIWFLFMYFWDCIPPLISLYLLTEHTGGSIPERIRYLWNRNSNICISVLAEVLVAIWYVIQQNIRESSEILGHDRIWITFFLVEVLTHSLHSVLNIFVITSMVTLLETGNSKKKSQPDFLSEPETAAKRSISSRI
jgi:hypothetical protein